MPRKKQEQNCYCLQAIIIYMESPGESIVKLLELTNGFCKIARYESITNQLHSNTLATNVKNVIKRGINLSKDV